MLRHLYPELFSPMLQSDGGSGGGNGSASGTSTDDPPKPDGTDTSESKDKPKSALDALSTEQQDEMNRLIDERVKRAVKAAEKETEKKVRGEIEAATAEADANQKGEWQKLAEQRKTRIEQLEADVKRRDRDDLARRIAKEHGLPDDSVEFLTGDGEDDLKASAAKLKKLAGVREAPDTEGGKGSNGTGAQSKDSTEKPAEHKSTEPQPAYTFDGRPKVAWNDAAAPAR